MQNQIVTRPAPDPVPARVPTRVSARARSRCRGSSGALGAVRWAPWLLTIALLAGCASGPPEAEEVPSAELYYRRALEVLEGQTILFFLRDVDYPTALALLQEVIDNYPYSEYATLAELKIADIHFARRDYEEAGSYYQDFVELHPTHDSVPYAIYRLGLCSFERMRDPDQDQAPTHEAISQFRVLLERYPDSEYADDAAQRIGEAQDRLATHEITVADFYFDRGECHAAAGRYRRALELYPDHTRHLRTKGRLATALKCMRRYYEAERLYEEVLAEQPRDDEVLDEVRAELEELRDGVPGAEGDRPLPRSCVTDPNPACPTAPSR